LNQTKQGWLHTAVRYGLGIQQASEEVKPNRTKVTLQKIYVWDKTLKWTNVWTGETEGCKSSVIFYFKLSPCSVCCILSFA